MASFNKYQCFTKDLAEGVHDFSNDVFKVALTNTAPNASSHTELSDITEISAGNGYSAGGVTVTVTPSHSSGVYKVVGTDAMLTASGGSIGPFRYIVFYNDTATGDPLIGWWDYGSSKTMADTDTFTFDFDGTNGILDIT